ncbi:hypothetical protein PMAYCL1PPCAC_18215 [Pristionchus mayeri]|uniref:Innexin n=1 Tax=Pristionchus mayeri TaxID=1317129 RepID=A0AAN5CP49_9BILA|nr:hypothetical protein PMAYCL1PPCAC_18215 [Pristionchus mayeri]
MFPLFFPYIFSIHFSIFFHKFFFHPFFHIFPFFFHLSSYFLSSGHPIECFVPAQFTRAMEQYTENYCWVQNTYWVPFQDLIPHRIDDRERRQIGYYQWAPFALIAAALMFHLPSSLWRQLAPQSGLNVSVVLQMACEQSNLDPIERRRTVDVLARHIDDALSYQRDRGTSGHEEYIFSALKLGKIHGSYVQTLYLFIKTLALLNVLLQFALLNQFLDTADYPFFGVHVLYDLFLGREWRDSGKFPRVTLCDFEIRVLGNIHRHTVQCVLVINMFTEKIFVCLWLWLSFLSLLSALNLLFRIAELLSPPARMSFVRQQLSLDSDQLPRFVSRFLRPDGVFLIRLLADHAGSILAARSSPSRLLSPFNPCSESLNNCGLSSSVVRADRKRPTRGNHHGGKLKETETLTGGPIQYIRGTSQVSPLLSLLLDHKCYDIIRNCTHLRSSFQTFPSFGFDSIDCHIPFSSPYFKYLYICLV